MFLHLIFFNKAILLICRCEYLLTFSEKSSYLYSHILFIFWNYVKFIEVYVVDWQYHHSLWYSMPLIHLTLMRRKNRNPNCLICQILSYLQSSVFLFLVQDIGKTKWSFSFINFNEQSSQWKALSLMIKALWKILHILQSMRRITSF